MRYIIWLNRFHPISLLQLNNFFVMYIIIIIIIIIIDVSSQSLFFPELLLNQR